MSKLLVIGIEKLLEELQRQNAEQRELLNSLSDSQYSLSQFIYGCLIFLHLDWRADSQRQHDETIEAVRSTAQEQVPFNVQGVSTIPNHITCRYSSSLS